MEIIATARARSPSRVPEWRSGAGDRIRIVVGSYEGLASPLVPAEPFNLLDVALRRERFRCNMRSSRRRRSGDLPVMHIELAAKSPALLMVNAGPPRQCHRFQAQRFGFLDAFAEDEENSVIG